jgi:hypothetical protein
MVFLLGSYLLLVSLARGIGTDELEKAEMELFRSLDENKDGMLETLEIVQAEDSEDEVKLIKDQNCDSSTGLSSSSSYSRAWPGQYEALTTESRFDSNEDNFISEKELLDGWRNVVDILHKDDVAEWIKYSAQLPQYANVFMEHDIVGYDLPGLIVSKQAMRELIPNKIHRARIVYLLQYKLMGLGKHPTVPYVECQSDRLFTHQLSWEWTFGSNEDNNNNNNNPHSIIRWNDNSDKEGWPRTHMFVLEETSTFMPWIFGDTFKSSWHVVQAGPTRSYIKTSFLLPFSKLQYRLRSWNAVGPSREIVVIDSCDQSSYSRIFVILSTIFVLILSIAYVSRELLRVFPSTNNNNNKNFIDENNNKNSPHVLAFFISPQASTMDSLNLLPEVRAMTAHGMFRSIEDLKCMGTLEDLQITLLERRPELLHLSTHSSSGSLVFDSPLVKYRASLSAATTERLTNVVDRQLLIDTICIHARTNLRCVFLNSCHTHDLAISLHKGGLETVICWRTKVADGAARDFADAFYRALSAGQHFKNSFDYAVLSLRRNYALVDPQNTHFTDPINGRCVITSKISAGIPVFLSDLSEKEQAEEEETTKMVD